MTQDIGVYLIVAAAAVYLLRTVWAQATGAKKGCGGCGNSGGGCGSDHTAVNVHNAQTGRHDGLIQISLNTGTLRSAVEQRAGGSQTLNPEP
jgi:hypothetical protein